MALSSKEAFPVAGNPGGLLNATQRSGGVKNRAWILLFGGPELSAVVAVTAPASIADRAFDAEIRDACASIQTSAVPLADATLSLPFTFRETARFRHTRTAAGNAAVLTMQEESLAEPQPVFNISHSHSPTRGTDRLVYAQHAARSIGGLDKITIEATTQRAVAGLEGVELTATALAATMHIPVRVVQWIGIMPNGHYIRMVAIVLSVEFADLDVDFEELRNGVAPKKD